MPPITYLASAKQLIAGAEFNETCQKLSPRKLTGVPKGIHRFRSHEDADRYDFECVTRHMAAIVAGRHG